MRRSRRPNGRCSLARTAASGRRAGRCAAVPRREPTSDWGISSAGIGRSVAEIHRGDCFAGGAKQLLSAERARAELADGVPAYGVCRPDRVLNRMGPDADRVGADRAVWVCGTGSGFLKYGSGPWFRWRPCSRRQAPVWSALDLPVG
ncbi:DUF6233 domain-containing protein [Streptomyces griseus]|uniref:DUF6233 domain-containing protein n=1 Tax=Streptomyces griseus TaxID=1911 RepID=UPI0036C64765